MGKQQTEATYALVMTAIHSAAIRVNDQSEGTPIIAQHSADVA